MNQPDNILNELQELSPILASVPKYNVLKAPEGYFEDFSSLMLLKVHAMESPQLSVPEGYFDNLPATIIARIKAEDQSEVLTETQEISATVAAIGNRNVFTVPEGYFESLKISNLETSATAAKVVSMPKRFSVFRYAAAAVVTGLIAISAYFMLNNNGNFASADSNHMAVMKEAKQIIKEGSFEDELNSISDAAIVNFLESKGQDVEAALVASLTNEKELPSADEYLFDDNTLDNVLKTIDL